MTAGEQPPGRIDLAVAAAVRRPALTAAVALLLLVAAGVALARVRLETDVAAMIRSPAARTFERAGEVFGLDERAYVLVEADRPRRERDLLRFGRALRERLSGSDRVAGVSFGLPIAPEEFVERLLLPGGVLYTPPAELPRLERLLTFEGMRTQLGQAADRLGMFGLGEAEAWVERDPLDLHRPLLARVRTLEGAWEVKPGSRYTLTPDGGALLVAVTGRASSGSTAAAAATVSAIDEAAAEVLAEPWAEGLTVKPTGGYHLAEESARIIQEDLLRSLSGSIVLAVLFVAFALRLGPHAVLALFFPTLWGVAVGAGLLAAVRPSVAVLAFGCTSILFGLGVDFMIHMTAAVRAERAAGAEPESAVLAAARKVRGALAVAALTTTAAFLAFLTSGQSFLQEMGLLVTFGLAACLAGTLLLLPPLLHRFLGRPADSGRPARDLGVVRLTTVASRRPWPPLVAALALTLGAAAVLATRPLQVEDDLRRIHARDSRAIAHQERIAELFGGSRQPVTILLEGPDEAAVVAAAHALEPGLARLRAAGEIVARTSVAALLPPRDEQAAVLDLLARHDPGQVGADLRRALDAVGFAPEAFEDYVAGLEEAAGLEEPLGVADLRDLGLGALVDSMVRVHDGRAYALVTAYPRHDLWDGDGREAVSASLGRLLEEAQVEGGLTGLYLVSAEAGAEVRKDFGRISLLTVLAVSVVIVLRFRRPGRVVLALLPAGLGALWTAALFALSEVRLNVMNLAVLPMVLAIGIDDGIHLLHHYLAGERAHDRAFRAAAAAVLLTSLTTMVTFGSLALSRNRGIASVGVLTFVGVGACLVASVTVLPAAMALLARRGDEELGAGD